MIRFMKILIRFALGLFLISNPLGAAEKSPHESLRIYRSELDTFREEYGGARDMPDVPFFQFGMGSRTKMLFKDGVLSRAPHGPEMKRWDVKETVILPHDYAVSIVTSGGETIRIIEDEEAVWIEQGNDRRAIPGTRSNLSLPRFDGHNYGSILRVLHHEILINVIDGLPVPNFYVYDKPWYRDGAMMALCLKATDNLDVIRDWVMSVREPYDRNNAGETEADNLGQGLFLVSLFADKNHPLVSSIIAELPKYEVRGEHGLYIKGRSDFSEHAVYQTKWLKYGLGALGIEDPYSIPKMKDGYSSLFWMDYREEHVRGAESDNRDHYPYLGWATDHFRTQKLSPISSRDYPLTWEINASQANYPGIERIDPVFAAEKTAAPHTWHAAEIFLYLLDQKK